MSHAARLPLVAFLVLSVAALAAPGCASRGSDRRGPGGGSGTDAGPSADGGGTDAPPFSRPDTGTTVPGCDPHTGDPGLDEDGDGFTRGDGDCNDCDAAANPGAFDFPENGADEDCVDGDATGDPMVCDSGLAMDSTASDDAARAIGLCKFTTEASREWGVISTRYTSADGAGALDDALQTGILPSFGVVDPPVGSNLTALSSGVARAPDQTGYTDACDWFGEMLLGVPLPPDPTSFPAGFPVESPSCPGVTTGEVYNAAALEVRLRVPTNARSLAFASNFYTYEYPEFICSEFNDFFVTLMDPRPEGLANDNVVFDSDGNLVSVNSSLLQVCEPGTHGGKDFACPQGPGLLEGTGFNGTAACGTGDVFGSSTGQSRRAATGWLRTTAPVEGGSIVTLRFVIWDSGDPDLDSTVLIDDFQWEVDEADVTTEPDPLI